MTSTELNLQRRRPCQSSFKYRSLLLLYGILSVACLLQITLAAADAAVPSSLESHPPSSLDIEPRWSPDDDDEYDDDDEIGYEELDDSWFEYPRRRGYLEDLDIDEDSNATSSHSENVARDYIAKREEAEIPSSWKRGEEVKSGILIKDAPPDKHNIIVNGTFEEKNALGEGKDGIVWRGKLYRARLSTNPWGRQDDTWKPYPKGTQLGKGTDVAVKRLKKDHISDIPGIMLAAAVKSPFLVPLTTYFQWELLPWLVMPLWDGDLLRAVKKEPSLKKDVFFFFVHLLRGLEALQANGLVHHDLWGPNFFVRIRKDGGTVGIKEAAIADFGSVKKQVEENDFWGDILNLSIALLETTSSNPGRASSDSAAKHYNAFLGEVVKKCTEEEVAGVVEKYFPRKDARGQELRGEATQNLMVKVIAGVKAEGPKILDAKTLHEAYVKLPDYQNARQRVCARNGGWGLKTPDCK